MAQVLINNHEQKRVERRLITNRLEQAMQPIELVENGIGSLLRTAGSKIAGKASDLKTAAGTFKKGAKVGYSSPGLKAGGAKAFKSGMRAGQAGAKVAGGAKAAGKFAKDHKRTLGFVGGMGAVGVGASAYGASRRKK
jgi:hypothetical protein